jgi:cell division protein FtsL
MNMADSFEYHIRKDVRNNPIVRELDRERQQELWRAAVLGLFLVVVLLVAAWPHVELRLHGYRLDAMQATYAEQAEINRHLRLEIDTLRSPARIEALATRQLGMVRPDPREMRVIERTAPAPAAGSLLARH